MTLTRLLAIAGIAAIGTGALIGTLEAAGPGSGFGGPGGPGGPGGGRMLFERFDVDGDGTITRAEFDQVHGERFGSADADGDGSISLDEFRAYVETRRADRVQMMFERLDTNNDRSVSAEEMSAVSSDRFAFFDRNGDDAITADEMPQRGWKGQGRRGGGGR